MPSNKTEILFVHGVQKTGTSTLVGMLNSHPQIFLLYETRMDRTTISKYGNQLLEHLPEARKFFRNNLDAGAPYLQLARLLTQHNPLTNYRYIGDKVISLDPLETQRVNPYKVIYAIRDARTWLCKEQIVKYFRTDIDVVPPAIDYLRYLIKSYQSTNALHIRLEDIVEKNDYVVSQLSTFLDLDFSGHSEKWWESLGQYSEKDPKNYIRWFNGHYSSKIKPSKLDTEVELLPHPFWQEYLPLFDKYINLKNEMDLSEGEMKEDLRQLETFMNHSPLPLEVCFKNINTQKITSKQSVIQKIKIRIRNLLK